MKMLIETLLIYLSMFISGHLKKYLLNINSSGYITFINVRVFICNQLNIAKIINRAEKLMHLC